MDRSSKCSSLIDYQFNKTGDKAYSKYRCTGRTRASFFFTTLHYIVTHFIMQLLGFVASTETIRIDVNVFKCMCWHLTKTNQRNSSLKAHLKSRLEKE